MANLPNFVKNYMMQGMSPQNILQKMNINNPIFNNLISMAQKGDDDNYERECFRETTVGEFVRRHPNGTYLVTMSGHITVVKDGINYDTFDCSDRIIWCAWTVDK